MRYYEAAYQDECGVIHPFGNGTPDRLSAAALCESLNAPNPRKPHPGRRYFVAFQDRPDWRRDCLDDQDKMSGEGVLKNE